MEQINENDHGKAVIDHDGHQIVDGGDERTGGHSGVYQDVIFDTKKKALPGVEVPKRAKNKDFQQIFRLLEVLFRYGIVCRPAAQRTAA